MIYVNHIEVYPKVKTLDIGETFYIMTAVLPEDATCPCVTFSGNNPSVATVDTYTGFVQVWKEGSFRVTVTPCDGGPARAYCEYTVENLKPVTAIELSTAEIDLAALHKGDRFRLNATVTPLDAHVPAVSFASSAPAVATVDDDGNVTIKSAGIARITALAQDGYGATAYVDVTAKQSVTHTAEADPADKTAKATEADPVDVFSGAHLLQNTLLSLFGGRGLTVTASYNSTHLVKGELGYGWHHNFEKHLEIAGDEAKIFTGPAIFSRYVTASECGMQFICQSPDREGYRLTVDPTAPYPYAVECRTECTEYYDSEGLLAKIVDHEGFEILLSHSDTLTTVTDAVSGKSLYLEKENGRLTSVYDDVHRYTFLTYTNDLLTEITDPNGHTLTFGYDEAGRIITGTDSEGICYFENTYDSFGRVKTQKDALGHTSTFSYHTAIRDGCMTEIRITTDREGKRAYRVYNENGLLTEYTDKNGNVWTYRYDSALNLIEESDPLGRTVQRAYNSLKKPTRITNRCGHTTHFTYDEKGNLTSIVYPAEGDVAPMESFLYNDRNQPIRHIDLRGTVTTYTYDETGMPSTKQTGERDAIVYTYTNGLLKSVTDAMGHTVRYTHHPNDTVRSMTDAAGHETLYEYDGCGNLTRTCDPAGYASSVVYDGNYKKRSVTDSLGNTTYYTYNGNMKKTSVTQPDGTTVHYEYDAEDRATAIIDRDGSKTQMTYDAVGHLLTKLLPDGARWQYAYDAVGNTVREIGPLGAVTGKTYDGLGNVLTVTNHAGHLTSFEYNAMSKPVKKTDARGGTTVYTYSPAGDLLSETDALGNTKTYTYDAFGNRLTATDAKNNVTTYTYDQNNNLLTVKDALNHVTTYTYNALNQCVSVKDALNNVIQYGYDALGRRTTITDARGNVFTTTYDGNGNVIKTTDAKGNTISETVYNSLNQPLTVTDAMGKATTYTYNALGKVESVTDSMNHRTEFSYNSRGQNTEVRDAANGRSTASYDLLGNVTRLAGPLGGATNYTYDALNRVTSFTTPSDGTVHYSYTGTGLCQQTENARGCKKHAFYDAAGHTVGYLGHEGAASYTYDANGNVLTVNDSHGTVTRTYDALNRVSSYTDTYGKVIRYEYDAVGNLSKIIYPDNTPVTYAYDANRNLIRVTDWAERVTAYTYDENNRVVGVTKPDGSVTTTVYDSKQRVTSTVERTAAGAVITGFEYTYDDLSRIIEEKVLANSTKMCYAYDSLSRVTARTVKKLSDNSVVSTETFNYDAAGNIVGVGENTAFVYDTNNRLISFNGNTVSYDLDGNMLSNGSLTCTYDSANRLVSAGGHTYTYNAEDVRIRNLCADEDTTYTYNTNAKLSMLLMKTTNGVVTKYVYGKGLIGEEVSGAFKTYHFDCRGSTIAITDASGNITDTFAYDTYGKLISRTGTSEIIFGYNGRDGVVTDDNGLIYMRARYYSPEMKRFINADIIAGAISNAITLNRFAYANGNPVSFVDPFGLSVWSWLKENVVDPVGNALTTAGNAIVAGAQIAGEIIVDTATAVGNAIVAGAQIAGEIIVDTATTVGNAIVDTATTVGNAIVDGAQTASKFIADTTTNVDTAIVNGTKTAINWTNENIIKPTGKALSNAGRQIKDGFNSVVKNAKEFGAQVGEFAKNTFGAGVVQSQTYDTMSMDTLIADYETGFSSSSVICGDISKPISVYAKNASEWWKIWEYKVGIQINIGDGGFYLETNPLENAMGVSNGNTSLELMSGLNKIGYTTSYEVDFSERTSGGVYQHGYIRTIPTAAAVVTAYCCWPTLVGALGTGGAVSASQYIS